MSSSKFSTLPLCASFAAAHGAVSFVHHQDLTMVYGAVSAADSFGALLETIPHGYLAILKPLLRNLIDVFEKLGKVEARLAKLVTHQTNSSWPPELLSVGVPR